jgi:hypothetical protein
MTSSAPATPPSPIIWLRWAFCFAVVAFVGWRVSENTADNDLWGHVLYGQRMLHAGELEKTETLSWTAFGQPWINHEVLAEIALGLTHRIGGGVGLWVLMMALAVASIGIAWMAGAGRDRTQRAVALALLALCGNFIALGYAARPQLFTYLCFVLLLLTLRRLFTCGLMPWALVLPLLLALWVNTHGGFLAGWLVVVLSIAADIAVRLVPALRRIFRCEPSAIKPLALINVALICTLALAANPWGWKLVAWTFETLRLPRPHITEWHPMPLAWSSLPFFAMVTLGIVALACSRQPRRAWETAIWCLFAAITIQHQRHSPLFGLATLVLLPVHVRDVLARFSPHLASLHAAGRRPLVAWSGAAALAVAGGACLWASTSPAVRPLAGRMAVPRDLFPVAAISFMQAHRVTGNTITFFDWGQHVLWELPDNPVSFDGRLDTVYPPEIMDAHWRLYAGQDPGPALRLARADCALLPSNSGGVRYLYEHGWSVVYHDPLATVLVRPRALIYDFSTTHDGGAGAIAGIVPFPDAPPALATRIAPAPES